MPRPPFRYALAIGSNQSLSARLPPRALLSAGIERIEAEIGPVLELAPTFMTPPLGPSRRRYANTALLVETALEPHRLLAALQSIETCFGRRRAQRWAARTLDIDIILWSGGRLATNGLTIPHSAFASRDFVLAPLVRIAPTWRDPRSGLTVSHLRSRLKKARKSHAAKVDPGHAHL